jgi:hypothetical protein
MKKNYNLNELYWHLSKWSIINYSGYSCINFFTKFNFFRNENEQDNQNKPFEIWWFVLLNLKVQHHILFIIQMQDQMDHRFF